MKRRAIALACAAVLLTGCWDDDDQAAVADNTVPAIATAQIAGNTSETALPLELNTLEISDAATDETSLPLTVN